LPYTACSVGANSIAEKPRPDLIAAMPLQNYNPIVVESWDLDSDRRVPIAVAELLPLTTDPSPFATANLAELEPDKDADSAPRQHPLILLAEDNQTNIETFMLYLTHSGYEIVVANDGSEAISIAQSLQPDLILMDIQMPGMDGFESISKIRQIPEMMHVPIIALTALAMPGNRIKCLERGADRYLSKPTKLKELRQTIAELIGSAK
jgi:CheY-like chemotaxis protein